MPCANLKVLIEGIAYGEMPEGLPGFESVARMERNVENLGDPCRSRCRFGAGRAVQLYGGQPMAAWESDRFIVLGDGRAVHMGKGARGQGFRCQRTDRQRGSVSA